ncbi:MAG: methionyl-tRNA formyltransferase [Flavobacteriales bacterium]|nr:methionyl-tRNA formyltransferase [Flavobacteriales bacterium]|tara:strand:- start:2114 stop:2731 length:618 start_codon:yes stop_codon:yes gene_type:complete
MEYNTKRNKLIIPEYGRHVQKMVNHAASISDKKEQKKCVTAIISFMGHLNPHLRDIADYKHKLWDHLYIMSDFKLDIESPFEKPSPEKLSEKPEKLNYPKSNIKYSYYGNQIQTMIKTAIAMENKEEKYIITGMIANHMKKCYLTWSKSSVDNATILKHLNELSNGQLKTKEDFVLIEDHKIAKKPNNKHIWKKKNNSRNKKKRN